LSPNRLFRNQGLGVAFGCAHLVWQDRFGLLQEAGGSRLDREYLSEGACTHECRCGVERQLFFA
jgi:hypothetical protein